MSSFNYTKTGLLIFIIGIILVLVSMVPLLFMIGDILSGASPTIIFGILAVAIFAFIGYILYLIGYIFMLIGGIYYKEYGEKHRKFLIYSLIMLLVLIIVVIIQTVYQSMIMFSVAASGDYTPILNIFYFSVVMTIISGLFYIFLLHELQEKIGKIILYVAFVVSIIISAVTAYLFVSNFETFLALLSDLAESSSSMSGSIMGQDLGTLTAASQISQQLSSELTKYSVFGIIPSILWFIAIVLPFYRMHTGKFPKQELPVNQQQSYQTQTVQYQTQDEMQKCSNCGAVLKPSSKFCEECGTPRH